MRRTLTTLAIAATILGVAAPGGAEDLQPLENPISARISEGDIRVELEPVVRGLTAPLWGTDAPGDATRLYVVDQTGILWAIHPDRGTKRVFLDVRDRLVELGAFGPGTFDERGFLGVAFHPDYASNGLLYTYTSEPASESPDFSTIPPGESPDHQSVIAEWQADPQSAVPVVDPGSRRELLRIDQPQFNHNGGVLNFGPDGMLYINLGDGGQADDEGVGHSPQGNGQDPSNPLGSILRIDPLGSNSANGQYGIPADNPFVGVSGHVEEIFAYGFRNPFRASFDAETGAFYVADVGQNDIEEVDVVTSGANLGWRLKEGTFCFHPNGDEDGFVTRCEPGEVPEGLVDPIAQYDHDDGIAVIGGFVYRGSEVGQLSGRYVFGDYSCPCTRDYGRVFWIDPERRGRDGLSRVFEMRFSDRHLLELWLLGFGQDSSNELYVLGNHNGIPFGRTGEVLKITTP